MPLKVRRQGRKGDSDPFSLNDIRGEEREVKDEDEVHTEQIKSEDEAAAGTFSQIKDHQSKITGAAVKGPRRILIFLKSQIPINFDQTVLKVDLEKEVGGDVSVFLNQDQYVINEIVRANQKSIILNLGSINRIRESHK